LCGRTKGLDAGVGGGTRAAGLFALRRATPAWGRDRRGLRRWGPERERCGAGSDVSEQAIAALSRGGVVWRLPADADELIAGGKPRKEVGGGWGASGDEGGCGFKEAPAGWDLGGLDEVRWGEDVEAVGELVLGGEEELGIGVDLAVEAAEVAQG